MPRYQLIFIQIVITSILIYFKITFLSDSLFPLINHSFLQLSAQLLSSYLPIIIIDEFSIEPAKLAIYTSIISIIFDTYK